MKYSTNNDSSVWKVHFCPLTYKAPFYIPLQIPKEVIYLQHRYIKLNIDRKYKTFITVILLAVYAFIATPVQLWHQHNYETNTVAEKASKEKKSSFFSTFSQQTADSNCQICSHHYSVFFDPEVVLLEDSFIVTQSVKTYLIFSIPSSPFLHFSNKGPPVLS